MKIGERNKKTLDLVREIGFDNIFGPGKQAAERIFFLGPRQTDGAAVGAHATPEAIAEFIDYWEHQIAVAKDYMENGCNSDTTAWKNREEPANRSCELEQDLLLRFCAWLKKHGLLQNEHEAEIQTAYFIGSFSPADTERVAALKRAFVKQRGQDVILGHKYDRAVVLEFAEWWTNQDDRLHFPPGKREVDQFFAQRKP